MPKELYDVGDVQKLRDSTRVMSDWANRSAHQLFVGADRMTRFSSGGVEQAKTEIQGGFTSHDLAQSATDKVIHTTPKSELWVTGNIYVYLYWSGDAGDVNTVALDCTVRVWAEGSSTPSEATVSLGSEADPNGTLVKSRFGPFPTDISTDLMAVYFERGSDSHAADINILGMLLDFIPSRI